jgi:hypothetical protein
MRHIGTHIVGSVFGPIRFLLPVCRLSWFLYTLNIYAHFSSHFSQQLLMEEIWYLVTAINSCWEKCDEKCAYMFNVYKNQQSRQTGSRNPMGSKTLPTIWGTYMKLVTKYQISSINSCWEKCDEKCAYMFNVYKNQLSRQTAPYRGKRFWTHQIPTSCLPTLLIFIHIEHICSFFIPFSQQLLMAEIWYLVTSFI